MKTEYQITGPVSISECDVSGRISPSALQVRIAELGELHAAGWGLSRENLLENGICWVLYRQRVVMHDYPTFGEEIVWTTWARAVEGPAFPRYVQFQRPDGTPVGEAVTAWVLIDINTRRPLRPSALPRELPICHERPACLPMPGILRAEVPQMFGSRTVLYSDIDVNGHMNNTRYINWICDTLDYAAMAANGLSEWQINYISEARPGEVIDLFTREDGGGTLHMGKRQSDGRTVYEARTVMGPAK